MKNKAHIAALFAALVLVAGGCHCTTDLRGGKVCGYTPQQIQHHYDMYDINQPQPTVITPGTCSTQEQAGSVPSDAIVLFGGKDLSEWISGKDGGEAKWKVGNGCFEAVPGSGMLSTKKKFGSCQLHLEFATPTKITGTSQGRGNSGVFLMSQYEIQILDSYSNITYPGGMAASVYGQSPPLVNAALAPGQWQSYDIIFHRPVFKGDKLVKPATVTVLYNGVLVQDDFEIEGPITYKRIPEYRPHADKLPLRLQDHDNPVLFRNIWIRDLAD